MIPHSGVTGDYFRGSPKRNHMPWGRLSPWKWIPRISTGVKAAGAYGWRTTILVVPNVKKIRGLNLPGTPWATLACCGM